MAWLLGIAGVSFFCVGMQELARLLQEAEVVRARSTKVEMSLSAFISSCVSNDRPDGFVQPLPPCARCRQQMAAEHPRGLVESECRSASRKRVKVKLHHSVSHQKMAICYACFCKWTKRVGPLKPPKTCLELDPVTFELHHELTTDLSSHFLQYATPE